MIKIKDMDAVYYFQGINFLDYVNIQDYFTKRDWNKHHSDIISQVICENMVKEK